MKELKKIHNEVGKRPIKEKIKGVGGEMVKYNEHRVEKFNHINDKRTPIGNLKPNLDDLVQHKIGEVSVEKNKTNLRKIPKPVDIKDTISFIICVSTDKKQLLKLKEFLIGLERLELDKKEREDKEDNERKIRRR